jgi:competence protein ComEC
VPAFPALQDSHWRLVGLTLLLLVAIAWTSHVHVRTQEEKLVEECALQARSVLIRKVQTAAGKSLFAQVTVELNDTSRLMQNGELRVCALADNTLLRLGWPIQSGVPTSGETWLISAKLRPPHGFANPGSFDFEQWLFSERVAGGGYITKAERIVPVPASIAERYRGQIRAGLMNPSYVHGPLLLALAIADTTNMDAASWAMLRNTGTIHVLVVSGLHITVVALLASLPGLLIGRLLTLHRSDWPAAWPAAITGVLGAAGYTAFTGMEVPALRAVIMLVGVTTFLLLARRLSAWTTFCLVFWFVVCVAPLSILAQGFWLSFGAVAVLLLAFAYRVRAAGQTSVVRITLETQIALGFVMVPWLALTVGQFALAGVWVNVLVVPLVSGIAIPVLVIGCALLPLLPVVSGWCFKLADLTMALVLAVLEPAGEQPPQLLADHPWPLLLLALLAGCLFVLPLPIRVRALLLPVWALVFTPAWPRLPPGEFRLHVLDVGQGSAALVETRQQTWIFDSGPAFSSGFDTGEAVVAPAVASLATRNPEYLTISHSDLDHAGGMTSLLRRYPRIKTFGSAGTNARYNCHARRNFVRDGVRFTFLGSAVMQNAILTNDRSCALLVDNSEHAILLTGDSSAAVEMSMLRQVTDAERGRMRVVLVPHHGSRSSSSLAWVRLLRPDFALISAGAFNPFGHPHPTVVERYQYYGAAVANSGRDGRLLWSTLQPGELARYRVTHRRYWADPPST